MTKIKQLACFAACLCMAACRFESPEIGSSVKRDLVSTSKSEETMPTETWEKVLEPREFVFPRDHGAHPDYKIEWWYYTGNLQTNEGRRFGFQLTFFRTGMRREPTNPSRWAVRDLYTAHLAFSDIEKKQFTRFERSSRGGIDWAGSSDWPDSIVGPDSIDGADSDEKTQRIWNGDWELRLEGDEHGGEEHHLRAAEGKYALELALKPTKPVVPHGEQGMSRKGAATGNASYYYSFTRMETQGKITIDGESFDVAGLSWMDHEFSSSFLETGQQGWDWFSIQLDGGDELMIYQIRRSDGTADSASSGTYVAQDGTVEKLAVNDFKLTPLATWKSPETASIYPIKWKVEVPSKKMTLLVTPTFPKQEMDTRASTGIIYWEGSVDVDGQPGRGYLEMTGYNRVGLGGLFK